MTSYSVLYRSSLVVVILVATTAGGLPIAMGAEKFIPFDGERTARHDGFDRFDFAMDEQMSIVKPFKRDDDERFGVKARPPGQRRCIVVVPKQAAAGNPWSWRGCYWDHEPQTEIELLRRGFHVGFITPGPGKPWDAWYTYLILDSTYSPLAEEKTYAICRGPDFVECFDRYDSTTKSPWGVTGMSVVVPNIAAQGRPWVFRADPIRPESAVDQALLAKGYHIVIAPLVAQSGPVREQWDAVYTILTEHGFARKPVMEGTGAAAGEVAPRDPKVVVDLITKPSS